MPGFILHQAILPQQDILALLMNTKPPGLYSETALVGGGKFGQYALNSTTHKDHLQIMLQSIKSKYYFSRTGSSQQPPLWPVPRSAWMKCPECCSFSQIKWWPREDWNNKIKLISTDVSLLCICMRALTSWIAITVNPLFNKLNRQMVINLLWMYQYVQISRVCAPLVLISYMANTCCDDFPQSQKPQPITH